MPRELRGAVDDAVRAVRRHPGLLVVGATDGILGVRIAVARLWRQSGIVGLDVASK
jgi:hypothetical protein